MAVLIESIDHALTQKEFLALCGRLHRDISIGKNPVLGYKTPMMPRKVSGDPKETALVFSMQRAGDIAPPLLRAGGFSVVRLDGVFAERHLTFEQALPELRKMVFSGELPWETTRRSENEKNVMRALNRYMRSYFFRWTDPLLKEHQVESYPERIPSGTEILGASGA
jgi:hypothetical protein